jgi:hypothetical protein
MSEALTSPRGGPGWSTSCTQCLAICHPVGAPQDRTATIASGLLAGIRPVGPVEAARKQLGRDLIVQIRQADQRLKVLTAQIAEAVAATGSHLTEVDAYRADRLRAAVGTHTPDEPIPHGSGHLPATPASPRSRCPAQIESVTGCRAAVTDSSAMPGTSSR